MYTVLLYFMEYYCTLSCGTESIFSALYTVCFDYTDQPSVCVDELPPLHPPCYNVLIATAPQSYDTPPHHIAPTITSPPLPP